MASLFDQIDRLSRNTRSIVSTVADIAQTASQPFTKAVLNAHLGDLIRDADLSELGLFRLNDPDDVQLERTQFAGATPLKKAPSHRENKLAIEPEVYANAALKYIDHYQNIRPMSGAYDRIVQVLHKLDVVRTNIDNLNIAIDQASLADNAPPTKVLIEQEERRVKDLEVRIAELSTKKEKVKKPVATRLLNERRSPQVQQTSFPSSPHEDNFWATSGEPSRTLHFSENILDEEVSIGDISSPSLSSPLANAYETRQCRILGDISLPDEPTITQFVSLNENNSDELDDKESPRAGQPVILDSPKFHKFTIGAESKVEDGPTIEIPKTHPRKIRVNVEVERIVAKIWSTISDIIGPQGRIAQSGSISAGDTIAHLQSLAAQSPQAESPIASSASSLSVEGSMLPTFQQIQTAYLLMMLLSAPHYSMPLNKVKENLALKAKSSGEALSGQSTTRVLFGCVAKRLVKIDRGGREQIVKFDI